MLRYTSLREILPLVTARLSEVAEIPPERILLVARQDTPRFQGDSDLVIRVGRARPSGITEGAGRKALTVRRYFQVTPRVRLAIDESDRDDLALLDDAGLLALTGRVIDALHVWVPQEGDDWLTPEPIHWAQDADPIHTDPQALSWLQDDLVFDVLYLHDLTDNGL